MHMKIVRFCVVIFIAALLLSGCELASPSSWGVEIADATPQPSVYTEPPPSPDPYVAELMDRGKLTVVTCADYEPYAYYSEGVLAGIDIYVARVIAEELSLDCELIDAGNFGAVAGMVASGAADIAIAALEPTRERVEDGFAFSTAYFWDEQFIVVRQGEAGGTAADMCDFGIVWNDKQMFALEDMFADCSVTQYGTKEELLYTFENGIHDAILCDRYLRDYICENMDAEVSGTEIDDTGFSCAVMTVGKDRGELLRRINEIIAEKLDDDLILELYYEGAALMY